MWVYDTRDYIPKERIRWRKGKDGHPEDRLKDIFLYQKRET